MTRYIYSDMTRQYVTPSTFFFDHNASLLFDVYHSLRIEQQFGFTRNKSERAKERKSERARERERAREQESGRGGRV